MSTTTREIGTLVVVVLKANHLPNKRHSKQNPYCTVTIDDNKQRTAAIKKGGQHPEWDQELRFPVLGEALEGEANNSDGGGPPIPPPKDAGKGKKPKIKGGLRMGLAVYADDPREPDLIGEATVDLAEVYTTGETDEWFELSYKGRFAGKVYLELTFWLHEKPQMSKSRIPKQQAKNYGGPGVFKASGDAAPQNRAVSYGNDGNTTVSSVGSFRPSSSLAGLDLYSPGYERQTSVESLSNDFGQMGMNDYPSQESIPTSTPSPAESYSPASSQMHRNSISGTRPSFLAQDPYQAPYESQSVVISQRRAPRYSLPAQSSGFVPLASSSSMIPMPSVRSHTPLPARPSESSSFGGPAGYYNGFPPQTPQPPPISSYPAPSSFTSSLPQPPQPPPPQHAATFPPPSPSSYVYPTYEGQPMSQTLQIAAQSLVPSASYPAPNVPGIPASDSGYSISSHSSNSSLSRPLPQQPVQHAFPMTANQQLMGSYNSMSSLSNFQNLPPPPPPLEQNGNSPPASYSPPSGEHYSPGPSLQAPGLPPPLPSTSPRPRRQSTLPQPPSNYYPLPAPPQDFLNVGPPPPLPVSSSFPTADMYNIGPPPPLPAPPVQVNRQWGPRMSQQWN